MSPYHPPAVRSILFATDFSDGAAAAMRWAGLLAKAHDAPVFVLHVAHVASVNSLSLDIQRQVTQSLEAIEAEFAEIDVQASSAWRVGAPWDVICDEAQTHDLVVIGARGHTPFLHVPIGSTADRVMRIAPVPVLTVHEREGAEPRMPRRLIVPTDFSDTARAAFGSVIRIFGGPAEEPLRVTLLHAWQPIVHYGDAYGSVMTPSQVDESEAQARKRLEALAAQYGGERMELTPVVQTGYAVTAIEDEAEAIDAELIAMGTHGRTGLARFLMGSVAERVMHRVRCPMLTVTPAVAAATTAEPTTLEAHSS